MKKNTLFQLFFFITLVFTNISCDKDIPSKYEGNSNSQIEHSELPQDILSLKKHFEKEILPNSQLRLSAENSNKTHLYYDWKKASKVKNKSDKSEYLVVPAFYFTSALNENDFSKVSDKVHKNRVIPNVSKSLIVNNNKFEVYTFIPKKEVYNNNKITLHHQN